MCMIPRFSFKKTLNYLRLHNFSLWFWYQIVIPWQKYKMVLNDYYIHIAWNLYGNSKMSTYDHLKCPKTQSSWQKLSYPRLQTDLISCISVEVCTTQFLFWNVFCKDWEANAFFKGLPVIWVSISPCICSESTKILLFPMKRAHAIPLYGWQKPSSSKSSLKTK